MGAQSLAQGAETPPKPTRITHATWRNITPPADNDAAMKIHGVDQAAWRLVDRKTVTNPLCETEVIDTCYWEGR